MYILEIWSPQIVSGLARGSLLFIMASGLSLILGLLRIPNFAHAALCVIGGYIGWTFFDLGRGRLGSYGFWAALILGPVVLGMAAGILERFLLRPLYRRASEYQIIFTYGLLLVLGDLTVALWGSDIKSITPPGFADVIIPMGAQAISGTSLLLIVSGLIIALAITMVIYHTKFGLYLRAIAQDMEMARLVGVHVSILTTLVFIFGAWLGGLGGVLLGMYANLSPGAAMTFTIDVFIVVIVGGVGSITGALVVAVLIGVLESIVTLVAPDFAISIIYLVMIVMLLVRPWGLLGAADR